MNIVQTLDVFTPASPAKLTFIERDKTNARIVRALRTTGNQLVIYGHSGCGKTTLIENKLFQIYERHVRTNCMKGMKYESVLLDAFDQLAPYFTENVQLSEKQKVDVKFSSSYALIKAQIESSVEKGKTQTQSRVLPPQLTAQNLARFMGEANSCWVLEDFHKLDSDEKTKLAQLMKVFMDMSSEYKDLKLIYVGATNSAREVVQLDKEMRRRVSEIHVPLMTKDEIIQIVRKGFGLLNIGIKDENIALDLYNHCSGLPSICHKLCLLICENMDIYKTVTELQPKEPSDLREYFDDTPELSGPDRLKDEIDNEYLNSEEMERFTVSKAKKHNQSVFFEMIDSDCGVYANHEDLKYALNEYLEDESDTIKCAFERAFKIESAEDILEAVSECDREGGNIDEITEHVESIIPGLSKKVVKSILEKLSDENHGSVIKFSNDAGVYSFSDPFFRTFSLAYYGNKAEFGPGMSDNDLMKIFNNAFATIKASNLA